MAPRTTWTFTALALLAGGCVVSGEFADGAFACDVGAAHGCPDGLLCAPDGFCRASFVASPDEQPPVATDDSAREPPGEDLDFDAGAGGSAPGGSGNGSTACSQGSQLGSPRLVAGAGGGAGWKGLFKVKQVGDGPAVATVKSDGLSHYIRATDFGFHVPPGAVVDGVQVMVRRGSTSAYEQGRILDKTVMLLLDGQSQTANSGKPFTVWPKDTLAWVGYGTAHDTWGKVWTPEMINHPSFGVTLRARNASPKKATARVEAIQIQVSYSCPLH